MRSHLKKMCKADNPNPNSLNLEKNEGMSIVSICMLYICWRVLYIFCITFVLRI